MNGKDNPNIYVPSNVQKEPESLGFEIWWPHINLNRQEFIGSLTILSGPIELRQPFTLESLVYDDCEASFEKNFWNEIAEEVANAMSIKKSDGIL